MERNAIDELLRPKVAHEDGRLHDVSFDGEPELPEWEPGIELGGAVQPHDLGATEAGLRASSCGERASVPALARPELASPFDEDYFSGY